MGVWDRPMYLRDTYAAAVEIRFTFVVQTQQTSSVSAYQSVTEICRLNVHACLKEARAMVTDVTTQWSALSAHARILAHQHADTITAKGQSIERQKQSRASRKDTAKAAKKSAAAAAASSSSLRVLLVQCVGFE